MRRLRIVLWGAVSGLFARFAVVARANEVENLRDELFEHRQRIKQLESDKAILEGELEELVLWRKKIIESIKAETQAQVAKQILATTGSREE